MKRGTRATKKLRVHAFVPRSRANGPGLRAVIWVQGCSLQCPGCFNPATHSFRGGHLRSVRSLVADIRGLGSSIEGITFSGGEPLDQADAVLSVLRALRRTTALSVVLFTGYTWRQVCGMPAGGQVRRLVDILVSGPYMADRPAGSCLLGSDNQEIHFLSRRYAMPDLQSVPRSELIVATSGDILVSGIRAVRISSNAPRRLEKGARSAPLPEHLYDDSVTTSETTEGRPES